MTEEALGQLIYLMRQVLEELESINRKIGNIDDSMDEVKSELFSIKMEMS